MEEISLREIIEIIIKGKWIIAVITAACVFVAALVSFFILQPAYEAETMLMISPLSVNEEEKIDTDSIPGIVSAMAKYPRMTLDTYKEQVKAPAVLEYVRQESGLEEMSLKQLESKIKVEAIENTNIVTISASDKDPELAARLANTTSEKFTQFVSETNRRQAENSAEFIKIEQEKEKEKLDQAQEELKIFLSQPRGVDELRQELSSKLSQLTGFKTKLTQITMNLNVTRATLEETEEVLAETSRFIETTKSVLTDDIVSGIIKDSTGKDTSDLAGIEMKEEEINEAYIDLTKRVNDLKINLQKTISEKANLEEQITLRQQEIEILQAELAEKQQHYDELTHNLNLIKQTYDAYQQKYKEAMIKQSAEIGKQSIVVVSSAIAPESPVSPNKKLNVAIAFVLGLMISAFIVFIKEYWENSSGQITVSSGQ